MTPDEEQLDGMNDILKQFDLSLTKHVSVNIICGMLHANCTFTSQTHITRA